MQVLRELTEGDQELTSFLQEMRATLVAPPAGALATALPARLAAEARTAVADGNGHPAAPSTNGHPTVSGRPRRAMSRPLLRVAVAIAAIPLLFTGLAFAGVNLPGPAKDAFKSIGIDLPNQADNDRGQAPADDGDSAGTAHDGDSAGSETGRSNSSGKLGHGDAKQEPARAEGQPGNDRAIADEMPAPSSSDTQGKIDGAGEVGGIGGKPTGTPESSPGVDPPESPGPPETPGSQGKQPGGVFQKGSSGPVGGGPPGG
jgi:hypothetical protein